MESTIYCFLHGPNYSKETRELLYSLQNIGQNFLSQNDSRISEVLLFGDLPLTDANNTAILNAAIQCIDLTSF